MRHDAVFRTLLMFYPMSLTGKALGYMNIEWEKLSRYIDCADL